MSPGIGVREQRRVSRPRSSLHTDSNAYQQEPVPAATASPQSCRKLQRHRLSVSEADLFGRSPRAPPSSLSNASADYSDSASDAPSSSYIPNRDASYWSQDPRRNDRPSGRDPRYDQYQREPPRGEYQREPYRDPREPPRGDYAPSVAYGNPYNPPHNPPYNPQYNNPPYNPPYNSQYNNPPYNPPYNPPPQHFNNPNEYNRANPEPAPTVRLLRPSDIGSATKSQPLPQQANYSRPEQTQVPNTRPSLQQSTRQPQKPVLTSSSSYKATTSQPPDRNIIANNIRMLRSSSMPIPPVQNKTNPSHAVQPLTTSSRYN